jgi:hypothetical protein
VDASDRRSVLKASGANSLTGVIESTSIVLGDIEEIAIAQI